MKKNETGGETKLTRRTAEIKEVTDTLEEAQKAYNNFVALSPKEQEKYVEKLKESLGAPMKPEAYRKMLQARVSMWRRRLELKKKGTF